MARSDAEETVTQTRAEGLGMSDGALATWDKVRQQNRDAQLTWAVLQICKLRERVKALENERRS